MRKKLLILIPLALIITTGAYALVANLFPDAVPFPRIPTQPGTIGYTLTKFFGVGLDGAGDAPNTLALSGVSASGYLQRHDCTTAGEVWIGVDASGTPICGLKGAILAFGILTEKNGNVMVNGTGVSSVPLALNVGDVVATSPGSSASIGFTTDNSIIRLDSDTSVTLQAGTLDGRTVAQVTLDNGVLWGRVLTSTGINFGAGGYIAGVRGTSIAMSRSGPSIALTIPHSTHSTDAVTVTNSGTSVTGGPGTTFPSLYSGSSYTPPPTTSLISALYDPIQDPLYSKWITTNTKQDILYLIGLANSGSTVATRELTATLPPSGSTECANLLTGSTVSEEPNAAGTTPEIISEPVKTAICGDVSTGSIQCGIQGLYWIPDLKECGQLGVAYADYTQRSSKMYVAGKSSIPLLNPVGVARFIGAGNFIIDDGHFYQTSPGPLFQIPFDVKDTGKYPSGGNPDYATQLLANNGTRIPPETRWITVDTGSISQGSDISNPGGWKTTNYKSVNYYADDNGQLNPTNGISITGSGYISYDIAALNSAIGGSLAGKTVTIGFINPISNLSTTQFLLSLGNTYSVSYYQGNWTCVVPGYNNGSSYACSDTTIAPIWIRNLGNGIEVHISGLAPTISKFLVGNATLLKNPLSTAAIKNITITP